MKPMNLKQLREVKRVFWEHYPAASWILSHNPDSPRLLEVIKQWGVFKCGYFVGKGLLKSKKDAALFCSCKSSLCLHCRGIWNEKMEKVKEPKEPIGNIWKCPRCDEIKCEVCIKKQTVDFDIADEPIGMQNTIVQWKGKSVCPWCYNQLLDMMRAEGK